MKDLNLLEHYNLFYKINGERTFDKSLLHFFNEKLLPQLNEDTIDLLEIGCGTQSLFESVVHKNILITAIDFSSEAINIARSGSDSRIQYVCASISSHELFLNKQFNQEAFDIIFDSHCLHCLVEPRERQRAYSNIKNLLKKDGLFASEMLITSKSSINSQSLKYESTAFELEQELIAAGFKIKYFVVIPGYFLESEGKKFDVLRVILEKNNG
jgi:SAM-dependent methyltransferase